MSVQWIEGEPPKSQGRGGSEQSEIRATLHANPGVWAVVKRWFPYTLENGRRAGAWAQNLMGRYNNHGIEAVSRRVGDEVLVYARAVTP